MSIYVCRSSILAVSFLLAPSPSQGGSFELISERSVEGEIQAVVAAESWRLESARVDEKPVKAELPMPFKFRPSE